MGQQAGKKDRRSNRTPWKNKRGDSKVESNDSPETLDMGEGGGGHQTSLASFLGVTSVDMIKNTVL